VAATLASHDDAIREARRLLRKLIRKARRKLAGDEVSDTDIHDARKRIKRARATLRLMRDALPPGAYRRENRLLRDAARPLSAARDAKILVEACDGVLHRSPKARHIAGVRRLRRSLVRTRSEARREAMRSRAGLRLSRRLLRRARRAARDWPLRAGGSGPLAAGAVRLYERGREALQRVRAESSVATLHEWRKQAKYLYLQLELLKSTERRQLGTLADELHTLSDELGEDHDLALLRAQVAAHVRVFKFDSGASELATLIEHSRTALQRRALLLGAPLYGPTRASFSRRLGL
jgi:CHAD domain-containing protein